MKEVLWIRNYFFWIRIRIQNLAVNGIQIRIRKNSFGSTTLHRTFFYELFFTHAETPPMLRFCFMIHSHSSWPRSGDCWGSRFRTQDSCVLCLVSPSCFNQRSHHIPPEPPHPPCIELVTRHTGTCTLTVLKFSKLISSQKRALQKKLKI
jgi:hypothetical protein